MNSSSSQQKMVASGNTNEMVEVENSQARRQGLEKERACLISERARLIKERDMILTNMDSYLDEMDGEIIRLGGVPRSQILHEEANNTVAEIKVGGYPTLKNRSIKKKRGRPRKNPLDPPKKKRGRPRKKPPQDIFPQTKKKRGRPRKNPLDPEEAHAKKRRILEQENPQAGKDRTEPFLSEVAPPTKTSCAPGIHVSGPNTTDRALVPPVKRGRGRPRKDQLKVTNRPEKKYLIPESDTMPWLVSKTNPSESCGSETQAADKVLEQPVKRGRGRPRKKLIASQKVSGPAEQVAGTASEKSDLIVEKTEIGRPQKQLSDHIQGEVVALTCDPGHHDSASPTNAATISQPVKRKRGRPRKNAQKILAPVEHVVVGTDVDIDVASTAMGEVTNQATNDICQKSRLPGNFTPQESLSSPMHDAATKATIDQTSASKPTDTTLPVDLAEKNVKDATYTDATVSQPVKRKRGRPQKNAQKILAPLEHVVVGTDVDIDVPSTAMEEATNQATNDICQTTHLLGNFVAQESLSSPTPDAATKATIEQTNASKPTDTMLPVDLAEENAKAATHTDVMSNPEF